jgi:DNA-binding transcriptional LysR family regulator
LTKTPFRHLIRDRKSWIGGMAFDGRLLSGIGVLAAVISSGSFARAAEALGLSASGVSRAVARLEARVGTRLLDRTTRALRLTDEGLRFYEQVGPLLDQIEAATRLASGASEVVRGRLRVNVDPFFSHLALAPRLGAFLGRYPELQLEIFTRDAVGELVAEGMDVAVRFGPPAVPSLVARKLLDTRVLTVAAPAYLTRHGRPATPPALVDHACIQFRDPASGRAFEWEFRRGEVVLPVATTGPLLVTDVGTMIGACRAGAGVAQVLALGVRDLLRDGSLVELFPDWPGESFPLYALHPSRHLPPAKVRAFIDFCREWVD